MEFRCMHGCEYVYNFFKVLRKLLCVNLALTQMNRGVSIARGLR